MSILVRLASYSVRRFRRRNLTWARECDLDIPSYACDIVELSPRMLSPRLLSNRMDRIAILVVPAGSGFELTVIPRVRFILRDR